MDRLTTRIRNLDWEWHVTVDEPTGYLVATNRRLQQVAQGCTLDDLREDAEACLRDLFEYLDDTYEGGALAWIAEQGDAVAAVGEA